MGESDMKKKAPDFTPEYTYERLGEILKDATLKSKTGLLDIEGKLYGIAAGYAQDFVDTSRAIKKPLDLTGRTEDNVFYTLLRVCAENQAQKKSNPDNKADMAKKLGYYQLFSLVNSMNCKKKCVEIAVQQGVMVREPKLVIRSLPDEKGQTHTFDVLDVARKTIDPMTIFDPKANNGIVLFGQLAPFYQMFKEELMVYIAEE